MKLWDEECRPYCRNIVEERYNQLAQELMDIPYHVVISSEQNAKNEVVVSMRTLFNDQEIFYTVDGREPQLGEKYKAPLVLSQSATVRAMCFNPFKEKVLSEKYILIHKALHKISKLNTAYSEYRPQYAASGKMGLADGVIGSESYLDGCWQGYWGDDIDVEFDFGKPTVLHSFKTRFLQNIHDWIMCPQTVELYSSKDGINYQLYKVLTVPNVEYTAEKTGIFTLQEDDLFLKTRYVRVVVKNGGNLPSWHQAPGQPSYIFCDEMIFN
jgi:hexosaminidase